MRKILILIAGALAFCAAALGQTTPGYLPLTGGTLAGALNAPEYNLVLQADQFPGADWGAKVNAAEAALGSTPGTIVYNAGGATLTTTLQPAITHANHALRLEDGTFVLNSSTVGAAGLLITANNVDISGKNAALMMGAASQDDVIRACLGTYSASTQGPCYPLYGLKIHGLNINGNQTGTTGYGTDTFQNGMNLNGVNRTQIYGNHLYNLWGQGIAVVGADSPGEGGVVSTSGTAVTGVSGATFDTSGNWNNLPIRINNVWYRIASVASTASLTLTASAGTQTSVNYLVPLGSSNQIHDNTVEEFGELGIGLETNINFTEITHNTIRNHQANSEFGATYGTGILDSASGGSNIQNSVTGNQISNLNSGINLAYGLLGGNYSGNTMSLMGDCFYIISSTANEPTGITIAGNKCLSPQSTVVPAFSIAGNPDMGATGYTVTGNDVYDASGDGAFLFNLLDSPLIANNHVYGYLGATEYQAFQFGNVRHAVISGNGAHGTGWTTGFELSDNGANQTYDDEFIGNGCSPSITSCFGTYGVTSADYTAIRRVPSGTNGATSTVEIDAPGGLVLHGGGISIGSSQAFAGAHGTAVNIQASDGTGTPGTSAQFASDGSVTNGLLASGAGAPSGSCTAGLYINTVATSASTVLYVCYPANTWTAVTVP